MSYQRDFEKRLRVAVVGAGLHAYRSVLPALHYLPVELVAICDLDEERARRTAREYGVSSVYTATAALYANVALDAVLLCVSPAAHPGLAVEAFGAGLDVWMEKPPAIRVAEIDKMRAAQGDRICIVGFKKAFMPATGKIAEIVACSEYGGLRSVVVEYPMTIPDNGTEVLENRAVTNWLANGCHPLSLLVRFAGRGRSVRTIRCHNGEGVCVIEFAGGVLATFPLSAAKLAGQPVERYLFNLDTAKAVIDNATVRLQRGIPFSYATTSSYVPQGFDRGAIVWEPSSMLATLENKALFVQGMVEELRVFCDGVFARQQPETGSLDFARRVMEIYEAALVSDGDAVEIAGGEPER